MGESEKRLQIIFTLNLRTLRPLRSFGVAQDMLCGRYSEIWLWGSHTGFFLVAF
jgi:hypothetical protein